MPDVVHYHPIPTMQRYHDSGAQIRGIVGPVGSGKTSAAAIEHFYYIPTFLAETHRITKTRHLVLRNTYRELTDTTLLTVRDWFPASVWKEQDKILHLQLPDEISMEILFRSCDRVEDIKKFKSLEITTYWADEAIEIADPIKRMVKGRIGRFPKMCPVRFGTETTNPPDVEHPTYSQFAWDSPPPGPIPLGVPLKNHVGFWQPPYENVANLRPGYYEDLRADYAGNPDWVATYIEGKPGVIIVGKLVYANFRREHQVATAPLVWSKGTLYRGWDNSGNCPACVVAQVPSPRQVQLLGEFFTERLGIVDFCEQVKAGCNLRWPGASYEDFADPAGENEFSKKGGGFTSNAKLMREECKIDPKPSEQNFFARISAVDQAMGRYDGLLIDPGCTRIINGFLGGYCYPEIGTMGLYRSEPNKNKYAHLQEAIQYLLCALFESEKAKKPVKRQDRARSERVDIFGPRSDIRHAASEEF